MKPFTSQSRELTGLSHPNILTRLPIPVRHSRGPLGLTLTLTLILILTPGMADLRNGGPPRPTPSCGVNVTVGEQCKNRDASAGRIGYKEVFNLGSSWWGATHYTETVEYQDMIY